jgi:hypothetical protein
MVLNLLALALAPAQVLDQDLAPVLELGPAAQGLHKG